jgi:hypothetical protein
MPDRKLNRRHPSKSTVWVAWPTLVRLGFMLLLVTLIIALPRINRLKSNIASFPNSASFAESHAESNDRIGVTETTSVGDETRPLPFADDVDLREALDLMIDKSLEFKPREMQAYWRLVDKAASSTLEELNSQAIPSPTLSDLFLHPESRRGELSTHAMTIRRVLQYSDPSDPAATDRTLYEIWGSNERTPNWLYVLISPELPSGYSPDQCVGRKALFVGFFLKLQGYFPAQAKTNDRASLAPLFIGRIGWDSTKSSSPIASWHLVEWTQWGLWLAILASIAWFGWRLFARLRPVPSKEVGQGPDVSWLIDAEPSKPDPEAVRDL